MVGAMAEVARLSRNERLALFALVLLALTLRILAIHPNNLWADEFFSLIASNGHYDGIPMHRVMSEALDVIALRDARPIGVVASSPTTDTHPPGFSLTLRLWREAFGEHEFTARAWSLVLSLVGMLALFDAARRTLDARTALWACGLYALASPLIHYGVEIRSNQMLVTMTLLMTACAVRASQTRSTGWLIATGVAAFASLMTHYFALASVLGVGLFVLSAQRRRRPVLIALAVAACGFALIQGPTLLQQRSALTVNMIWLADTSDSPLISTLGRALVAPVRLLMFEWITGNVLYLLAAGFWFVAFRIRREAAPWLLLLALPILQAGASDLMEGRRSLDLVRYTLPAAPAACVVVALALRGSWHRWVGRLLLAAVVVSAWVVIPMRRPDATVLARAIDEARTLVGNGSLVVVAVPEAMGWRGSVMYASWCAYGRAEGPALLTHEEPLAEFAQRPMIWAGRPDAPLPDGSRVVWSDPGLGRVAIIP
jgi:4-amino-4-deoxy-L-arabinose transferase-like glycosyltransferase